MFWSQYNKMIGIIKFFDNESYLDLLIAGTLYCNTPEFYRQSRLEGVSDKNESCLFSYRRKRGDEEIILEVNGIKIKYISRLTAHNPGFPEAWLHCWMALELPDTYEELESLKKDILRLKIEFGNYYAFISFDKITSFFNVIQTLTTFKVILGNVAYSDKATNCGPACKDVSYAYQREFRFLIGECGINTVDPLVLNYEEGFNEYIQKNPEIIVKLEGQNDPLFQLTTNKSTT